MNLFLKYIFWFLCLGFSACAKPVDLDTPCPDYGRHCSQAPINAWDNDEHIQ